MEELAKRGKQVEPQLKQIVEWLETDSEPETIIEFLKSLSKQLLQELLEVAKTGAQPIADGVSFSVLLPTLKEWLYGLFSKLVGVVEVWRFLDAPYEFLRCLSATQRTKVWLVSSLHTKEKFVLKHYLSREEAIMELRCLTRLGACKRFPSCWPNLCPTVGDARLLGIEYVEGEPFAPTHLGRDARAVGASV